jgi:hypothetical protein
MATAPQTAMEMPEQGANPFADPNTMAVYDQMRQTVSPKQFGDEMLAGASQIDPRATAQFMDDLSQIDLSPEDLEMLNNMVDEILANPEEYAAVRAKYLEMGAPEELLPEQFDPQFFAAMNMAVDQLIAEPAGVQAFAQGGIAELKPIAKAIASYGRNGDTMLAHITPAEARMLRRRGGSGTTNPVTGLPEFFLKKAFKSLGKAIKKFASSTVGRLVTGLAVGFFLGPAAVAFFGATAGTITAAAITGFTASAGSSLLAGDGLKTAIKQGVVGAATAGAIQGVGSAISPKFSLTGQAPVDGVNPTAMEALKGQYNKVFAPTPTGTPTAITGGSASAPLPSANQPPVNMLDLPANYEFPSASAAQPPAPNMLDLPADYKYPSASTNVASAGTGPLSSTLDSAKSMFDSATGFVKNNFSPSAIQEAGANEALAKVGERFGMSAAEVAAQPANSIIGKAYQTALPGILSTYGPATALGLGATALAGGFTEKPVQSGPVSESNRLSADERMRRDGTERLNYLQNMPGVVYNERGEPVSDQSTPFPAYVSPGYANSSNMPFVSSAQPSGPFQGMSSMYTPPPNSLTNRAGGIYQPYNNQSMYPSLAPPQFPIRYAAQGGIAGLAAGGYPRRTGQISGPGTAKSDSIPAMLSDGEFVMTAAAVRGAGKGSRREGAKKMYKLMHQLEKNSERG